MGSVSWDFEHRNVAFSLRLRAEFDPSVGAATVSIPWLDAAGAPAAAPISLGSLEGLPADASRGRGCGHQPGAQRVFLQQDLGRLPVSLDFVQALRATSLPVSVQFQDEDGQSVEVPSAARVHLGPLLLASAAEGGGAGSGGDAGEGSPKRLGPSMRPWPTEVSATHTETIGLVGLYHLELQIVTDVPILSQEMLNMLMPACFTVDAVRGLPNEHWLPEACDDLYVEVFPQLSRATSRLFDVLPRTRSLDRPHSGSVRFCEPVVWFLGVVPLHVVREWLQHDGVVVEVHDRDSEANLQTLGRAGGAAGGEPGDAVEGDAASDKGFERQVSTCDDLAAVLDRHGEVELRKPHPHGVARFPLAQLVQMQTLRLELRSEVSPARSDKKRRLMEARAGGLRAAGLVDTPEGEEIVAQRSGVDKREYTTDYHSSGAVVTMHVGLAVPLPDANEVHERELQVKLAAHDAAEQPCNAEKHLGIFAAGLPAEEGGAMTAPFRAKLTLPDGTEVVGTWRDTLELATEDHRAMSGVLKAAQAEDAAKGGVAPSAEELEARMRAALAGVEAPPQRATDLRFERFGRAVLVADESELDVVRAALDKVLQWNAGVKGIDPNSAEVNNYRLTDADKEDPHIDLLTGFAVLDGKSRVMVFEGLLEKGLQALLQELGRGERGHGAGFKLLSNPQIGFSHRLYAGFGSLKLHQIKLRAPLEKLARKPNLYVACGVSGVEAEEAGEAIKALLELKQATRLKALRKGGSFPKSAHLGNLQILYGGYPTDAELEARATTAASRASGRNAPNASASAASLGAASGGEVEEQVSTLRPGALAEAMSRDLTAKSSRRRKAHTDAQNTDFQATLALRKSASAPNFKKTNKEEITRRSEELAKTSGKSKQRDTPFLEGQQVYLYSGQKLNSAELQKAWMREHMDKEQKNASWTYCPDYLSCGFEFSGAQPPGLTSHQATKPNDTHANPDGDQRAKWRNPPARPKEDFRKPAQDVSHARREELHEAFVENEWNSLRLGEERAKPLAVHLHFEPDKVPHRRTITEQPFDASRMGPQPSEFGPLSSFESVHYHGRMPLEDRYAEAERHNVRERNIAAQKIRGSKHMKSFSQGSTRHCVADTDRHEQMLKDPPAKKLRGKVDGPMPVTIRNEEEYHECGNPAKEWHARLRENDSSPPYEAVTGTLKKAPWRHGAPPLSETQKAGNYMSAKDFNLTKPPGGKRHNESHVWKNNSRAAIAHDELRKLPYQRPIDYGVAHMLAART